MFLFASVFALSFLGRDIVDNATGGWGHLNVDQISQNDPAKAEPLYNEKYRPQFHFSAKKNWLNDPNGLVYDDSEYHLFFQHNPGGIQWGDMHWGHAVSPDLLHWHELPIALAPDALGTMFSGSAVVDTANTTGFGKDGHPPLVAMYTAAGKPFTQCLAYSNDRGRTWTKYAGNPVLPHVAGENRDPRILWHQPSHQWIIALYLDGDEFAFFGSPDLKSWKELSRLRLPGSSECPELFEIPVEGSAETRWVFFGADYHYLVGQFDGVRFTPASGPQVGDYGANFYASQTYSQTPDGRRILIGWMRGDGPFPGMPFNQQMSFPRELRLLNTPSGLRLCQTPIREIAKLRKAQIAKHNLTVSEGVDVPIDLHGGLYDLHVKFRVGTASAFGMHVGKAEIVYDAKARTLSCLDRTAPIEGDEVDLRILVDRSSVEVYAQGGLVVMTSYRKPAPPDVQGMNSELQCGTLPPLPLAPRGPVRDSSSLSETANWGEGGRMAERSAFAATPERFSIFARGGSASVSLLDAYALASAW